MEFELSYQTILLILFFTGMAASIVDAIAGGGGLISIPALLAVGVSPHVALGTNKLQSMVGTTVATLTYYRKGLITFHHLYLGLIYGFIGSVAGAIVSQELSNAFLSKIIPFILIIILLYTVFSPNLGELDRTPKISEKWFYAIFGSILGFYDGFFGPGAGSFWIFALVYFLGFNIIKASAYTKVLNLNTNIFAAICFAVGGNIDYTIALCMGAGQLIGGQVGAHMAIRGGHKVIRPVFIFIVAITIASVAYKAYAYMK